MSSASKGGDFRCSSRRLSPGSQVTPARPQLGARSRLANLGPDFQRLGGVTGADQPSAERCRRAQPLRTVCGPTTCARSRARKPALARMLLSAFACCCSARGALRAGVCRSASRTDRRRSPQCVQAGPSAAPTPWTRPRPLLYQRDGCALKTSTPVRLEQPATIAPGRYSRRSLDSRSNPQPDCPACGACNDYTKILYASGFARREVNFYCKVRAARECARSAGPCYASAVRLRNPSGAA